MEKTYFITDENFEKIIKEALSGKEVLNITSISTSWTNIVFEAQTNEGNYFFRFPKNDFWIKTIVKDAKFSQYIYHKTTFNTVRLELLYDQGRPFSMHKKIEGVSLAEKMDTLSPEEIKKVADEISDFMYQLHQVEFNENEEWTKLSDFLDELVATFFAEKDKKFWKHYDFMDNKQRCLVHGDLNSSNILIDENNHISAIIDFGFAGFGDKYSDIARIIGRCPENYKNEIVNHYEELSNVTLDKVTLDSKIDTWKHIDNGYINYMTSTKQI